MTVTGPAAAGAGPPGPPEGQPEVLVTGGRIAWSQAPPGRGGAPAAGRAAGPQAPRLSLRPRAGGSQAPTSGSSESGPARTGPLAEARTEPSDSETPAGGLRIGQCAAAGPP